MTLTEYLDNRKNRTFTIGQAIYILEKYGFSCKLIDTLLQDKQTEWSNGEEAKRRIHKKYKEEIPFQFAYIKFYEVYEEKEEEKHLYALVAGKTNLGNPDFGFKTIRDKDRDLNEAASDNAKVFLGEKEYFWHCQKVLAVWKKGQRLEGQPDENGTNVEDENKLHGPQARRAMAIERDIGGLLGLWGS